jgi:hypothetical protein
LVYDYKKKESKEKRGRAEKKRREGERKEDLVLLARKPPCTRRTRACAWVHAHSPQNSGLYLFLLYYLVYYLFIFININNIYYNMETNKKKSQLLDNILAKLR